VTKKSSINEPADIPGGRQLVESLFKNLTEKERRQLLFMMEKGPKPGLYEELIQLGDGQ
jgi:hypothetical protein